MATAFESEAVIGRSAAEVWSVLTDWSQAPRWMASIDAIAADGATAVGTRLIFTARGRARPAEIDELDEGRLLVVRSQQGPVTADYRYQVEPAGAASTRCRLRADCAVCGPLVLLAPLLRRALRRADAGQPAALRALMEG